MLQEEGTSSSWSQRAPCFLEFRIYVNFLTSVIIHQESWAEGSQDEINNVADEDHLQELQEGLNSPLT